MKNKTTEKTASVSRKPQFKGLNHPIDLHKAFRGSGNHYIISSILDRQHNRRPAAVMPDFE